MHVNVTELRTHARALAMSSRACSASQDGVRVDTVAHVPAHILKTSVGPVSLVLARLVTFGNQFAELVGFEDELATRE